ncbi:unnamed protein product [Gongylonema pulchrum]|uniref:C2H2-type domain-containing protein n=1 Tax=Gongylonema pulchrum TaxID=637853 RepID=A0A183EJ36_9BILA|nr:unnamed protein product [Gongylonema pulchrum]
MPDLLLQICFLALSLSENIPPTIARNIITSTHLPDFEQDDDWPQNTLLAVSCFDSPESLRNAVDFAVPDRVIAPINQQKVVHDNIRIAQSAGFRASEGFDPNRFNPVPTVSDKEFMLWESILFEMQRGSQPSEYEPDETYSELFSEETAAELVPAKSAELFNVQAEKKLTPEYSCPSTSSNARNIFFHGFNPSEIHSTYQMLEAGRSKIESEFIKKRYTAELLHTSSTKPATVSGPHTEPASGPSVRATEYKETKSTEQFDFAKCQRGFTGKIFCHNSFLNFRLHLESHNQNSENCCRWHECGKNFRNYRMLDQHYFEHLATNSELVLFRC